MRCSLLPEDGHTADIERALISKYGVEFQWQPEVLRCGESLKSVVTCPDRQPIAERYLLPTHGVIHPIHAKNDRSGRAAELVQAVAIRKLAARHLEAAIDTHHGTADQGEFAQWPA